MLGKHVLIWLVGLLAAIFIIPVFATPSSVWNAIQAESVLVGQAFGNDSAVATIKSAQSIYNAAFVSTGFVRGLDGLYVSKEQQARDSTPFANLNNNFAAITNNWLECFALMVFAGLIRFIILLGWLPYLLPFLLALVVEGLVRRKIKRATFAQQNTALFAMAAHVGVFMLFLPIFYLLLPFPISPLFLPMWALIGAIPVVVLIGNSQLFSSAG